jgi:hypothetical protein
MARKTAASDSVDIKKIKTDKQAFYNKLKYLSKWLFSPDKDITPLIENKKEFDSNLRYRLYNNFLNYPKIIWYLNKYLNSLYSFHSLDPESLLITISHIARIYGLTQSGQLYFSKYQPLKRDSFTNILNSYGEESGKNFNSNEVQNLYRLFEVGFIKSEDLEALENMIEGKEKIKRSTSYIADTYTPNQVNETQTKSPEIISLCNSIISVKERRTICKSSCPLRNKQSSVLDTNISSLSQVPIDIAVVANETATEKDISTQTPLSEDELFRPILYNLVKKYNLKYIITNGSLCFPEGKTLNPTDIKKVLSNCKGMIDEIHNIFKPKIVILFGSNNIKNYGIKEKKNERVGELILNKYFCMPSPDEVLKSKTSMDRYQKAIYSLDQYCKAIYQQTFIQQKISDQSEFSDNPLSITETRFEKGDTLFNVEILNDQVIYIMVDSNGKKKYIIDNIKYPIYIKPGKYKDCEYVTDNVELMCVLTAKQKHTISSRLNQYIKNAVEC